jgi:hypothetical protein
MKSIVELCQILPDEVIVKAYHLLHGDSWANRRFDEEKIFDMKSIFKGGTKPCCSFENWYNCIEYLKKEIETYTLSSDDEISMIELNKKKTENYLNKKYK